MRRISALLLVSTFLALLPAASCFNLDDRPPPPTSGAIIAGTVQVASESSSGGSSVRRGMSVVGPAAPAPAREAVPLSKSKLPREWRAGDVLVLFEKHAHTKASLAQVMPRLVAHAGYADVDAAVVRCTAGLFCVVELTRGGRPLDVEETEDAQLAIDAALKEVRTEVPELAAVRRVALNMKKWGFRVPNDPFFSRQWHFDAIGMQAAWEIEIGDPDLVIAVIDCGLKQAHPDLANRIARDPLNGTLLGADLISDGGIDADDFPGRDTDPDDPGDQLFGAQGSSFHGSHIAGTIAAETDNGEGVAGVTWNGQILPVRVLGLGLSGFDGDIIDGMFWALGNELVEGVPANVAPARILNLSLGGPSDEASQEIWDAVGQEIFTDPDSLYNDPILIAAAGNSDEDAAIITPANLAGMITVGASNIAGLRTSYSNYGAVVDVMAPGGDQGTDLNSDGEPDQILSSVGNTYEYREGTSMAAPHVAGVAALLVSENPALTQTTVEQILKASANPAGQCSEGCGEGLLDAVNALLLAGGEIQPEPLLATDLTQVFFPEGLSARTFHILNLGNAPLDFTTVIEGAQAALFRVEPASGTVPAALDGGRLTVTVTLTRGDFEAGGANLRVQSTDVDAPQSANVDLDFNDDPTRSPRQIQTVQVAAFKRLEGGGLEKVAETFAESANGFQYEITGLRAGDYEVHAVGDDNQDGTFALDTESSGAYPTRSEPQPVTVGDNQRVDGIDFGVSSRFITDIVGGVGAPCDDANDCTFAPDADCVVTFEGGYCSRFCDDGFCDTGRCALELECLDENGDPFFCDICLARCASDAQCRFDEGYVCDQGECVPESFTTP